MTKKSKKFYWLKLEKDFFKRHDIKIIESMPNGKDYILFYLKLILESMNHEGRLRFSDTIPYNDDMLATITNTNVDIVRSAIKMFVELGLMEIWDDKTIFLIETQKMVGNETEYAAKKRLYREQKLLEDKSETKKDNVRQEIELDIELEIEKELEIDIEIYKDILSFWNNQKIVQHRKMTDTIKGRINSKLDDYSVEEIKQSILNYSYILQSDDYFLDYRWTLVEFMDRGFEKMLNWELAEKSYRRGNVKTKESNPFAAMLREMQ